MMSKVFNGSLNPRELMNFLLPLNTMLTWGLKEYKFYIELYYAYRV